MHQKPLVGISSCLLGKNVRYDGGHKLDHYLVDILGQFVEYVPICPEVECGMTIPREALRLVAVDGDIRLMTQKSGIDMTPHMKQWMKKKLTTLTHLPLCGFIFKTKSPSSGLFRVKVYHENGTTNNGVGIFAQGLTEQMPYLPVEEDQRLYDSSLRENFIERLFAMHRWLSLVEEKKSLNNIIDFHARHKYLLMAHSPAHLTILGSLVANGSARPLNDLYNEYFITFFTALKSIATVKKNTNVL
ncbi:MAG: DUF1722 domain-containing protein, partial [Chitinivibrionales bacterium]|nr:DUF1722 domain-containing protein [Chitinivibrionales bacterium]